MLVTFHSDAYEDITYFGDVAKQLLSLMGHSGTVPGAIKFEDLPQALEHLQQGLANGSQSSAQEDEDGEMLIGLDKRAIPLLNMLQASIRDECNILWDA
ncbi:DUF1840 domain-containing protein [Legionella saoudiensis]|uniref:DUF1840 domain-containing protein n=1 Tax=Legionella saoudiensis TaxID=1750561 RepID=UPI0007308190|nr:DUF1840 domain-containing protein [Legionella saoudiensis]